MSQHSEIIKRLQILERDIVRAGSMASADRPTLLIIHKLVTALHIHFINLDHHPPSHLISPDVVAPEPDPDQARADLDVAGREVPLVDPEPPNPEPPQPIPQCGRRPRLHGWPRSGATKPPRGKKQ